jgi:hypothetical protein
MGDAILVASEGKNELCIADVREKRLAPHEAGALACLIHRLLNEPPDMEYIAQSVLTPGAEKATKRLRPHRSNSIKGGASRAWEKKALFSVYEARRFGAVGCAIVIDQDCNRDCNRLRALKAAQASLEHDVDFPPCAVGVAVETFDAWMIVDGRAAKCAGAEGANTHGEPEKLTGKEKSGNHPKDRAEDIFGGGLTEAYSAVAPSVDLAMLRERCPNGFGAFADDVQSHLGGLAAEGDN